MEDGPSGIITNGGCGAGYDASLFVHGEWAGNLTIGMKTKEGHAKSVTVYAVSSNCSDWS